MRKTYTMLVALFATLQLVGQVSYTAQDSVSAYEGLFRPGINMGYHPNWTNQQLATIGAGNPAIGQLGAGAKAIRPGMEEYIFSTFGYDLVKGDYEAYKNLGMIDMTAFLQGPSEFHRDFTNYCSGQPSAIFRNIYLPIWDDGTDGTPYNDDNYYAAYVYQIVENYKEYVTFWEIWNEPGFDFTQINGRRVPGEPGNWWDNDPNPCDYALKAPIQSYVRMLRISWEIIKTLDPDSYVTLGDPGFPSFMDAVLRNTDNPIVGSVGAVSPDFPLKGGAYFDCVSFHAYPHFDFTAYDPFINLFKRHSDGGADGLLVAQARYQDVLDDYGFDGNTYPKKEWIVTEFNAPRVAITGPWMNGIELQRNYMLKVLMLAKVTDIAQMHVYEMFDNRTQVEATTEFDLMGLYKNEAGVLPYNQVANPQAKAMKTFTDLIYNTEYDAAQTASLMLPAGVRGYAFRKPDSSFVYALWAETQTDLSESATANYAFPTSLGLTDMDVYAWDFGYSGQIGTADAGAMALTEVPVFYQKNTANSCSITTSVSQVTCNDNGTDSDSSDDIFGFEVLVTGNNTSMAWSIQGDTINHPYNTGVVLDSFPINGGNLTLMLVDTSNATCTAPTFVVAPASCSAPPSAAYCNSSSDFPWHEWIAKVKLGGIDNTSSKNAYTDFTAINTNLLAGQEHPIELTSGFSYLTFNEYWHVWIDYDKDMNFEPSELVFEGVLPVTPPAGTTLATLAGMITIPANAATGTTRMRVSMRRDAYGTPCALLPYGEVEDYKVTILAPTSNCSLTAHVTDINCTDSGTPSFGGDDVFSFNVTMSGINTGSGWEANTGINTVSGLYGTAKNFSGYPTLGSAVSLTIVDLENSDCSTTVQVASPTPCSNGGGGGTYCTSTSEQPWLEWIAKVKVGNLEWLSGKSNYSDFLANTFTLKTNEVQTVQLTTGFSWQDFDEYWRVWIDFDKDGLFEANEMVIDSLRARPGFTSYLWSFNSEITLPETTPLGVTRMRVVMQRDNAPDACGTYTYGETEDFSVNIVSGSGGGSNCSIFAQQTGIACQDAGTPTDPSDDTFQFNLLVNGANTALGWIGTDGTNTMSGIYGQAKKLGPFPIADGGFTINVRDGADSTCLSSVVVVPPNTCSDAMGSCTASSNFPWHDWIEKVEIGSLNSPSTKSQYSDFTAKVYNTSPGTVDTIHLTFGFSWFTYGEFVRLWIDFNQDGIYAASELVLDKQMVAPPNGTYTFTYHEPIVIPAAASLGATTMRLIMRRDDFASACDTFENGEVEDYGVVLNQLFIKGNAEEHTIELAPDKITVYPNPVGERLHISLGNWVEEDTKVTLFNQFGKQIESFLISKNTNSIQTISMENVINGAYWLRFESPGKRVFTERVVVARDY